MKLLRTTGAMLMLAALLAGCATQNKWSGAKAGLSGQLQGSVTYRERMALPADARVIVRLEDVSRKDASGAFVAQQTLRPRTEVPIAFNLRYLPAAIDTRRRYALHAAIVDAQDELLWISSEPTLVQFNETAPIVLTLERALNPSAPPPPAADTVVGFRCDDFAFIAKFFTGKVEIALAGRTLSLPQVLSGSGARYSDGKTTFWNKGDTALFQMNGVDYKGCRVDPATKFNDLAPAQR
ncbi:MAG TPA: YbaY family lipoprotein [Oxalicibacterium sp.]|nr:YbaY family lipoprotein [Oxalicibacterium sp.]